MTENNAPKIIIGLLVIALSIFVFFQLKSIGTTSCDGWNTINPICWVTTGLHFIAGVMAYIILLFGIFMGIMIMLMNKESWMWFLLAMILGIAAVVMIILSPGIPFDELLLGIGSLASGIFGILKRFDSGGSGKLEGF